MVKRSPVVYIPIEFGAREFDGKALLAATLAKRGYCVLFGEQWTIGTNFARLPPGAALFKSFNALHRPAMAAARAAGHHVHVLEEELLAHTEAKAIGNFCTEGIFKVPEVIIANGEFEKATLVGFGASAARVEVAGNPRIDILKPAFRAFYQREVDAIRARFGRFVLVNTNFGTVNSFCVDLDEVTRIHVQAGFVKPHDPDSIAAWNDQIEFEQLNKAAIISAVKDLCRRRPDLTVVIRPHPAEDLARWNGVFAALPRVSVVREGPHVPWTLACDLLLHTSCTTGFEAHVAGRNALSLVAKPNWISRSFISNRLNPMFDDPAMLAEAASAALETGAVAEGSLGRAGAEHYVWNIGERNSGNRLATVLTRELPGPRGKVALPALEIFKRQPQHKAKFSLSLAACGDAVGRIFGIIGQPPPLTLDQIGDSLFYLAPAA